MTPSSGVKRAVRVARQVRERIAASIARDIADPRLAGVVVTRVEMPDDLQLARVWVRLSVGGDDPAERTRVLAGLRAATGLLRRALGETLELRRTPELRFLYDAGQDAAARVDALLDEIAHERDALGKRRE